MDRFRDAQVFPGRNHYNFFRHGTLKIALEAVKQVVNMLKLMFKVYRNCTGLANFVVMFIVEWMQFGRGARGDAYVADGAAAGFSLSREAS